MDQKILSDFLTLVNDVVQYFKGLNFYIFIAIIILHFYYQLRENNYKRFFDMCKSLISLRYIYRYIRYSFVAILALVIYNHFKHINSSLLYFNYEFSCFIFQNIKDNIFQYLILILITSLVVYTLFKNRISNYLEPENIHRFQKNRLSFFKFCIFNIFSFGIQFSSIYLAKIFFEFIDSIFITNQFYPYTNLQDSSISLAYKQGVYISFILSLILIFFLINAIYKNYDKRYSLQDLILYFFVILVVGFGCYSGFYSVLNFYFNIQEFGFDSEWLRNDKLIGNYSVRITSLILLWSILKYLYKSIFKENFLRNAFIAFLPIEVETTRSKNLGKISGYNSSYYDNLYFAQVGFYILNVFTAEYLLSNSKLENYLSFLFLLLPIIVDDFFVIHVYHKEFGRIDRWHNVKLISFNFILFISASLILYRDQQILELTFYVILTLFFLHRGFLRYIDR